MNEKPLSLLSLKQAIQKNIAKESWRFFSEEIMEGGLPNDVKSFEDLEEINGLNGIDFEELTEHLLEWILERVVELEQTAKTTNQIRYGMRNSRMKGTEKWILVVSAENKKFPCLNCPKRDTTWCIPSQCKKYRSFEYEEIMP